MPSSLELVLPSSYFLGTLTSGNPTLGTPEPSFAPGAVRPADDPWRLPRVETIVAEDDEDEETEADEDLDEIEELDAPVQPIEQVDDFDEDDFDDDFDDDFEEEYEDDELSVETTDSELEDSDSEEEAFDDED